MKTGLINIDLDYKTIFAAGLVVVFLYAAAKKEATSGATAAADYVNSGAIGGGLFDATHVDGKPTALGRFFDWVAGIKKGVDY